MKKKTLNLLFFVLLFISINQRNLILFFICFMYVCYLFISKYIEKRKEYNSMTAEQKRSYHVKQEIEMLRKQGKIAEARQIEQNELMLAMNKKMIQNNRKGIR